MIIDQQEMWNQKHEAGEHAAYRDGGAPFAANVEPLMRRHSELLELGCGVGGDAYFFAEKGHHVLATDFSRTVLEQDRALLHHPNLTFAPLDLSKPLPYKDQAYDVVFAHLSLHYYNDVTTHKIFNEINRVLKIGGLLCFACKSPADSDYGNGEEIEPDYFASQKGHLRHFFSKEYAMTLLGDGFIVKNLNETTEYYVDKSASFIQCVAEKANRTSPNDR